jgi:hypothetical protein
MGKAATTTIIIPAGVTMTRADGTTRTLGTSLRAKAVRRPDEDDLWYFLWLNKWYSVPCDQVTAV